VVQVDFPHPWIHGDVTGGCGRCVVGGVVVVRLDGPRGGSCGVGTADAL